jgi:hypothetical protein
MVEIAVIFDADLVGVAHRVNEILSQNGISPVIEGSIAYGVCVESKDEAKAIKIIEDDPELKSKKIELHKQHGKVD